MEMETAWDGCVLGFNSPDTFAQHDDTLYMPAANGVIVHDANGVNRYWKPTRELYKIDKIAVSSRGILCLTEKRLEVSLLFYRVPSCQQMSEVRNAAAVSIEDMAFSGTGDVLYVLCTIPTSVVKVYTVQANGTVMQKESLSLAPVGFSRVHPEPSSNASFYVWGPHNISYLVAGTSDTATRDPYGECMRLQSRHSRISALLPTENGVLIGYCDGTLAYHALGQAEQSARHLLTVVNARGSTAAAITWIGAVSDVSDADAGAEEAPHTPTVFDVADSAGCLYRCRLVLSPALPDTTSSGDGRQGQANSAHVYSLCHLGSSIARVESVHARAGSPYYMVAAKRGVYAVDTPAIASATTGARAVVRQICARSSATVRCISLKTDRFVIVARNGDVTVSSSSHANGGDSPLERHHIACRTHVVDATLLFDRFLIVLCERDSTVRCLDLLHETDNVTTFAFDQFKPIHCCATDNSTGSGVNGVGRLLLSDEASTHFITVRMGPATSSARPRETGADGIQFERLGYVEAALSSPLALLYWLPTQDGRFLATCENGELYLLRYPEEGDASTEHSAEVLTENIWRLDFPVVEMFACLVHADVINLLVHSVDKDTKLYAVDRKREADGRVLRPLFMMRDHENGGTVLRRYDSTTVLSAGHDGRIVLRDVSHYQSKLSPIPPSKEKRKPIQELCVRHAHEGGITAACFVPAHRVLVCGGECDAVVTVLPASPADDTTHSGGPAVALTWHDVAYVPLNDEANVLLQREDGDVNGGVDTNAAASPLSSSSAQSKASAKMAHALETRSQLSATMEKLRSQWNAAMQGKDDDVPVEALLIPSKQEEFEAACDAAIFDMREREYYNTLMNEYLQDMLRKRCCDSMDVGRVKTTSITQPSLEVHNFQVLKSTRTAEQVIRKFQFLRRVQKRVGHGRAFSPQSTASLAAAAAKETPQDLLWQPTDIYTTCRAVVQLYVLKGLILSEKDDYNRRFTALREKKRSVVSLIQERTSRCVQIRKQLGLHDTATRTARASTTSAGEGANDGQTDAEEKPLPELFVVHVDREEDPNTLFQIYDDELDEEARSLVVKDTGARIYSPSNEAAIKQWMDGLEKDVEVLEVHLRPPEFADEARGEGYVPPDERTDEQVRQVEEYERLLKEETEAVNTKRAALRNEFRSLQTQNRDAAAALDVELKQLRTARLAVSERVCHYELQQVEMARRCLLPFSLTQAHTDLLAKKTNLSRRLRSQTVLLEARRDTANSVLNELEAMEEQETAFATRVRDTDPFTDTQHGDKLFRRFSRWKNKFDEDKAEPVERAARPDEVPEHLWEHFCDHCATVVEARQRIRALEDVHKSHVAAFEELEAECHRVRGLIEQCDKDVYQLSDGLTRTLLNTRALYQLQQGQVQDERVVLASEFASSRVRWVNDVHQYNELILASDSESTRLLEKIVQRERNIKAARWETERLRYGAGTLQVELRQLHTLRVTRQMQEWMAGDTDVSEEKTLARIDDHMRYVEESMNRKAEGLKKVIQQLKHRIAERNTENDIVDGQTQQLRSTVHDQSTVKSLVDSHADGSYCHDQRAKEIYQTSELEELARSQQEELLRLKREVDRLRERTFPSFAVVSKRTT